MSIKSGVVFDCAKEASLFQATDYGSCRIYIPKSRANKGTENLKYFWSRFEGRIYFGDTNSGPICVGEFFSNMTKEEQTQFATDIWPVLSQLESP